MYTFNFNLGGDINTTPEHDYEPLIEGLKHLLEDWQSFYNLYKKFAPPPTQNQEQILHWFNELKESLQDVLDLYHEIPNAPKLDKIRSPDDANDILNQFLTINSILKPENTDDDELMYN